MGFLAFAQIDVSAIRADRARSLQLWYGGRAFDHAGRGVVPVSAIGQHLSRASRVRAIHRGDGLFWTLAGRRLFLYGVARVALALGLSHVSTAYRAQRAWLRERSLCKVCSQVFLGGLAVLRDGRPIAVATMAQLAGRSVRTIRTWLRRTKWGRTVNILMLEQIAETSDGAHVRRRSLDGQVMRIELDGGVWLGARLPNSLEIRHQRVQRWAALRRTNARLTSHFGDQGQQPPRYVGRRRPRAQLHPIAQDTAYQFHTQLPPPQQVQVWIPFRSPKRRVQFLKHPEQLTLFRLGKGR